jgi:hypothetical protein
MLISKSEMRAFYPIIYETQESQIGTLISKPFSLLFSYKCSRIEIVIYKFDFKFFRISSFFSI